MRHSVLAQSIADATRLRNAIDAEGWFARIVNRNGHIGLIIHAPSAVVSQACRRVSFVPGRTIGAR